jgi:hypothetical protein
MSLHIDIKGCNSLTGKANNVLSILLIVILILLIGFRALEVGADTESYLYIWNEKMHFFDANADVFFYYIMYSIKAYGFSYQYFTLIISTLFFTIVYITYKKISKFNNINLFLFLFSFFSFFFCLSLSTNVIRQGISLAFLLPAYFFYNYTANKKKTLVFLSLSIGFHLTAIIPIGLFLIVYICKKVNLLYYYFIYVAGIITAYIGYDIKNASFLSEILADDRRNSYLLDEGVRYVVEFKTQFVIFNSIFIIIFALLNRINKDKKYKYLLKYYILSSVIFFLAFQFPFSDRFGLFSWFFIPLLLTPVFSLNSNKYRLNSLTVLFLILIFIFFNVLYK